MADFEKKRFLDEAGLQAYDELIKAYIDQKNGGNTESINDVITSLAALSATVTANETLIQANTTAIQALNGDATVAGSVDKKVADAIAALVDGAPEALDTLKELADWVKNDQSGATALVDRVDSLENANTELKDYVDAQDMAIYNSIQGIEEVRIAALFPVKQTASQTAVQAIAAVDEGKAVQLTENQTITDNVVIDKNCYIDANGSTFEGTVTVPADKEVVIVNAVFSNPVVMA